MTLNALGGKFHFEGEAITEHAPVAFGIHTLYQTKQDIFGILLLFVWMLLRPSDEARNELGNRSFASMFAVSSESEDFTNGEELAACLQERLAGYGSRLLIISLLSNAQLQGSGHGLSIINTRVLS